LELFFPTPAQVQRGHACAGLGQPLAIGTLYVTDSAS
jgi:hypothetical protein